MEKKPAVEMLFPNLVDVFSDSARSTTRSKTPARCLIKAGNEQFNTCPSCCGIGGEWKPETLKLWPPEFETTAKPKKRLIEIDEGRGWKFSKKSEKS